MDGGAAYEAYVQSYRREVQLADKCRQVESAISILDQLVTIFTLATPSQLAQLGQLQSAITDKRKELNDMVCNSTLVYL